MPVETLEERGEAACAVGEMQPVRCLLLCEAAAPDLHQVWSLEGARSWEPLPLSLSPMPCGLLTPGSRMSPLGPGPHPPDPCCTTLAILEHGMTILMFLSLKNLLFNKRLKFAVLFLSTFFCLFPLELFMLYIFFYYLFAFFNRTQCLCED